MELAIIKKAYEITMSNGDKHTVMLENDPGRDQIGQKGGLVHIDRVRLNMSYCASIREIDMNDERANTALARAEKLKGPIGAVAVERVRKYEEKQGHKMGIGKIQDWIESFRKEPSMRPEYYKIYEGCGGDGSDLYK